MLGGRVRGKVGDAHALESHKARFARMDTGIGGIFLSQGALSGSTTIQSWTPPEVANLHPK